MGSHMASPMMKVLTLGSAALVFFLVMKSCQLARERTACSEERDRLSQELTATKTANAAQHAQLQQLEQQLHAQGVRLKELEARRDSIHRLRLVLTFDEPGTPSAMDASKPLLLFGRARLEGLEEMVFVTSQSTVNADAPPAAQKLSVTYEPKDPDSLIGRPLSLLASMSSLVIDSLQVLRNSGLRLNGPDTKVAVRVELNGINVLDLPLALSADAADTVRLDVGEAFSKLPAVYAAAIPAAE